MMRCENAAVIGGFLGREVGGEDAVGAGLTVGMREFFEAHLQYGIVVAEEHEGNLRGLTNAVDDVDYSGKRGAGLEGAFGGALDSGAIGEGVAEGDAELDYVGAGIG